MTIPTPQTLPVCRQRVAAVCVAAGGAKATSPEEGKGTQKPHSKDANPANRGHPNVLFDSGDKAEIKQQ